MRERRRVHLLLGFGAGALLGATFFDLLPEAISAASRRGWTPQHELTLVLIGFVVFHVAERFIEFHCCQPVIPKSNFAATLVASAPLA